MKYVSFSLWGDNPLYTEGAVINSKQIDEYYPGWKGIFYYDESVPKTFIEQIEENGSITVNMEGQPFGPFLAFFGGRYRRLRICNFQRLLIQD